MSETAAPAIPAAPAAAPAAPQAAPAAPAAPAAAAPAPAAVRPPASAREFDRSINTGRAPTAPAPAAPAAAPTASAEEQARDAAGRFAAKPDAANPAPAPGGGAQPPATPTTGPQAAAADAPATPSGVPDGYVRIELPEGLQRTFGKERIVPKGDEEFVRFAVNNHVRKAENDTLKAERQQLSTDLQAARERVARLEALPAISEKFRSSEGYRGLEAEAQAMEQLENDGLLAAGTAARYRKATLDPAQREFEEAEFHAISEAQRQEHYADLGGKWAEAAYALEHENLPDSVRTLADYDRWFGEELVAFERRMADGYKPELNTPELVHAEFDRLFRQRLWNEPAANPHIRAYLVSIRPQQAPAPAAPAADANETDPRVLAAAAALHRQEQEREAANRRANPMGVLPSGAVTRSSGDAPTKMNARQFDKAMRSR